MKKQLLGNNNDVNLFKNVIIYDQFVLIFSSTSVLYKRLFIIWGIVEFLEASGQGQLISLKGEESRIVRK